MDDSHGYVREFFEIFVTFTVSPVLRWSFGILVKPDRFRAVEIIDFQHMVKYNFVRSAIFIFMA